MAAIFSCLKPDTFNPKPSLCMSGLVTAAEFLSAPYTEDPNSVFMHKSVAGLLR